MAKYLKREVKDPVDGVMHTYYQMKTTPMDGQEFIKQCVRNTTFSEGEMKGLLELMTTTLSYLMARGYSVKIDGLGTFRARLGRSPWRDETDNDDDGEHVLNARSLAVTGVNFRAERSLTRGTATKCRLESGGRVRMKVSKLKPAERLKRAQQWLTENGVMRVADYARMTGLSRTTAGLELRRWEKDPTTGITSSGSRSSKVYVLRKE